MQPRDAEAIWQLLVDSVYHPFSIAVARMCLQSLEDIMEDRLNLAINSLLEQHGFNHFLRIGVSTMN
jgi:hypothetical protein